MPTHVSAEGQEPESFQARTPNSRGGLHSWEIHIAKRAEVVCKLPELLKRRLA